MCSKIKETKKLERRDEEAKEGKDWWKAGGKGGRKENATRERKSVWKEVGIVSRRKNIVSGKQ